MSEIKRFKLLQEEIEALRVRVAKLETHVGNLLCGNYEVLTKFDARQSIARCTRSLVEEMQRERDEDVRMSQEATDAYLKDFEDAEDSENDF